MTVPLWDFAQIAQATASWLDNVPHNGFITGVSIDTRTIEPGDLFVALSDARDGHEFVTTAFKNGAAAALVNRDYARQPGDGALLRVDDPLCALEALGRAARARLSPDARVIAVTGSAGKTTTKEMLRACFSAVAPGQVHASEKSYNNHWGVPLTLARMPADTKFAVFEIGMNHAGEITPLTKMVRPHVAVITTVAAAHLGNFNSIEEIAEAKAEIILGLEAAGTAIIPRDNPYFDLLAARATQQSSERIDVVSFGFDADAVFRLIPGTIATSNIGSDALFSDRSGLQRPISVFLPGNHNLLNALAVQAALVGVGISLPDRIFIGAGLPAAVMAGRGKIEPIVVATGSTPGFAHLIDQSYNANPASMRAEIEVLGTWRATGENRLIAVLGDMLELGPDAPRLHAELVDAIEAADVDLVFACGPHMRHLFNALPAARRAIWAETAAELEPYLLDTVRAGDVVMIKGSNGSRMAPLVTALINRHTAAKAAG